MNEHEALIERAQTAVRMARIQQADARERERQMTLRWWQEWAKKLGLGDPSNQPHVLDLGTDGDRQDLVEIAGFRFLRDGEGEVHVRIGDLWQYVGTTAPLYELGLRLEERQDANDA